MTVWISSTPVTSLAGLVAVRNLVFDLMNPREDLRTIFRDQSGIYISSKTISAPC